MGRVRSAGFVITLEFLLVMALFVVPVMLGFIMVGRKLFTLYQAQREAFDMPYSRAVVWDSSGNAATCVPPNPVGCAKVVGPVIDYDQFEAPLVIFRDDANKAGVVLGVRRDRFTSHGQVFYTGANCTGTPHVRAWDLNVAAPTQNLPAPPFAPVPYLLYPPTGFVYQMQGVSYAMGLGNILYRSALPAPGATAAALGIVSAWMSESITPELTTGLPIAPCFGTASLPNKSLITGLVAATEVIDFDGTYTWPFRLAFPTPAAAPALSCPNGEC